MGVQQGAAVAGMNDQRASSYNVSRYNAIKHGLTAKTPVLPGEDPAELQAKIDAYKTGQQTRTEAEGDLATLAAMAYWRAMRANRLEVNRMTGAMVARSRAEAVRETTDAEALGDRLLFDRRGPSQLYPSRDYEHKEPRNSSSGEPGDPDKPVILVRQLEATRAGRQWLRERLGEVREPIDSGEGWVSCEKFKAIRLLGKQPLDALWDSEVARLFLASYAIRRDLPSAFHELRCEIHYDRVKRHESQLSRKERRAITPPNAAAARDVLLAIIDQAIERLWKLDAEYAEGDEILELTGSNVVSDAEAKHIAQVQRHLESSNRLAIRNLDTIKRWHRWEEEGWYKVRRDRERRKEEARRGRPLDQRFVLDQHGTVRDAWGYEGDLEAGLARWKAERGPQPCEDPYYRAPGAGGGSYAGGTPNDVSAKPAHSQIQGQTEAITDGACETAARNGNAQGAPGTRRPDAVADDVAVNQDADSAAEMRDGAADSGQAGVSDFVPVILTGHGPATNIQNEIDGLGMDDDGVLEEAGDGVVGGDASGAREAGRTGEDDGGTCACADGWGQEETYGRADGGVRTRAELRVGTARGKRRPAVQRTAATLRVPETRAELGRAPRPGRKSGMGPRIWDNASGAISFP